jgi:hypothetical protein
MSYQDLLFLTFMVYIIALLVMMRLGHCSLQGENGTTSCSVLGKAMRHSSASVFYIYVTFSIEDWKRMKTKAGCVRYVANKSQRRSP